MNSYGLDKYISCLVTGDDVTNSKPAAGISCLTVPTEMSEHHDFAAATDLFGDIKGAANWILSRF